MKTIKLLAFALFCSAASFAQQVDSKQAPIIPAPQAETKLKFEKDTHDFGNITQNTPVTYEFSFKNTSNKEIAIVNAQASCGCTAPKFSTTPIKPGEKGTITAIYNAAAANGFEKTITVTTTEGATPKVLRIKGFVAPATPAAVTTPSK